MTVEIVDDGNGNECPGCGAYWGHPDKALDFPNRTKVLTDEADGWWWRCYNPACNVGYYNPQTGGIEESLFRAE